MQKPSCHALSQNPHSPARRIYANRGVNFDSGFIARNYWRDKNADDCNPNNSTIQLLQYCSGVSNGDGDKMRGNDDQMRSSSSLFLKVNFQASQDNIESAATCFNVNCAPEQMAQSEIAEWLQQIRTALPNVRALICRDDAPWDSGNQRLTWNCAASGSKSSAVIKLGWTEKNEALQTEQTGSVIPPPRLAIAVTPYTQ